MEFSAYDGALERLEKCFWFMKETSILKPKVEGRVPPAGGVLLSPSSPAFALKLFLPDASSHLGFSDVSS